MRKLNKFKEMSEIKGYMVIYERIKSDLNGNPRYEVSLFDNYYCHKGTYNIVSYSIEKDINNLIETL